MSQVFTVGMLVQHSNHWLEQHGNRQEDALGIVTGFQSSWEGEDWPLVHWESADQATACYPGNIEPVDRAGLRIRYSDG